MAWGFHVFQSRISTNFVADLYTSRQYAYKKPYNILCLTYGKEKSKISKLPLS